MEHVEPLHHGAPQHMWNTWNTWNTAQHADNILKQLPCNSGVGLRFNSFADMPQSFILYSSRCYPSSFHNVSQTLFVILLTSINIKYNPSTLHSLNSPCLHIECDDTLWHVHCRTLYLFMYYLFLIYVSYLLTYLRSISFC